MCWKRRGINLGNLARCLKCHVNVGQLPLQASVKSGLSKLICEAIIPPLIIEHNEGLHGLGLLDSDCDLIHSALISILSLTLRSARCFNDFSPFFNFIFNILFECLYGSTNCDCSFVFNLLLHFF